MWPFISYVSFEIMQYQQCDIFVIFFLCFFATAISDGYNDFQDDYRIIYDIFTCTNAFSLLFISMGLLLYGVHLKKMLIRNSIAFGENAPKHVKEMIVLSRINIVLLICIVCHSMRAACLTLIVIDSVTDSSTNEIIPSIFWFTISNWVPLLLPVSYEMYLLSIQYNGSACIYTWICCYVCISIFMYLC